MRNTRQPGSSAGAVDVEARRLRELLVDFSRRRSLRDPVSTLCEEAQLTPPQIHALLGLGHDGPLTMGELARRVGVTEKTITGLVDRLAQQGYLERERDQDDRRIVRARLTARGHAVYRDLDRHLQRRLAAILAVLHPADRRALHRILAKLIERLVPPAPAERTRPP